MAGLVLAGSAATESVYLETGWDTIDSRVDDVIQFTERRWRARQYFTTMTEEWGRRRTPVCKGKHTPGLKGEQLCGTYWSSILQLKRRFKTTNLNLVLLAVACSIAALKHSISNDFSSSSYFIV
jgi:hypothetical protein